MKSLSYTSDQDRSYGAAGMAIGLTVYRGQGLIASISIDREPSHIVELTPDYFFAGSPEISAKASWGRMVDNFNYSVVMLLSNVLCRALVANSSNPEQETIDQLREAAHEEGQSTCELEEDEISALFNNRYDYLRQVFSHGGVRSVAHDLASAILSHRQLSRMEVFELLDDLGRL